MAISNGNSKLGKIPNVPLVPIRDCANCEACKRDCYALKAWRQYPDVRKSWKANSDLARKNRPAYWGIIREFLARKSPRFFRWHVAGDILDQDYFNGMAAIAREFPNVRFLCFTKRYDLSFRNSPRNLQIVLSAWPGMRLPRRNKSTRIAWLSTDPRAPKNAIQCPGLCDTCGMCWNLSDLRRDVVFDPH